MKTITAILITLSSIVMMTANAVSANDDCRQLVMPSQITGMGPDESMLSNDSIANGQTASGEQINWYVISPAGTESGSVNYWLAGTAAQTAVGISVSSGYRLSHGYWYQSDIGPPCEPGDANGSGGDPAVDIDDVVYLISYIFSGGPPPVPLLCCGNADGKPSADAVDIDDVVYLINFIFSGGPPPVEICP